MMTTKRFNALDADLISSSRAQQVAVTEFPWVILVLVISVSSFLHRILRPVVVSGRPRENCCPSCSSRQSAAAWLPLIQWEHATNRICAQKVGACAHTAPPGVKPLRLQGEGVRNLGPLLVVHLEGGRVDEPLVALLGHVEDRHQGVEPHGEGDHTGAVVGLAQETQVAILWTSR